MFRCKVKSFRLRYYALTKEIDNRFEGYSVTKQDNVYENLQQSRLTSTEVSTLTDSK